MLDAEVAGMEQPPAKAFSVEALFLRYPFITTLPRNITSPIVSPSAGTLCIVSGSMTSSASSAW